MNDNFNYETYVFISLNKLSISVKTELDEKIYYEELLIKENPSQGNFERLDTFLDQNILKIEKKIKNFIEKIIIILDLDVFFPLEISVKKNNLDNQITYKSLNYLLYEAKESCKETLDKKKNNSYDYKQF